METVITILGITSMLYLAYWAYSLVSISARVKARLPSQDRLEHERRMLQRRRNKGYHV